MLRCLVGKDKAFRSVSCVVLFFLGRLIVSVVICDWRLSDTILIWCIRASLLTWRLAGILLILCPYSSSSHWLPLMVLLFNYTLIVRSLLYCLIWALLLEWWLRWLDSSSMDNSDLLWWVSPDTVYCIWLAVGLVRCRCIATLLLLKALTSLVWHPKLVRPECCFSIACYYVLLLLLLYNRCFLDIGAILALHLLH